MLNRFVKVLLALVAAVAFSDCNAMMQFAHDEVATNEKAEARLLERFSQSDGYEPMRDFEEFKLKIGEDGPTRRMKFCMYAKGGAKNGKQLDEAKQKFPNVFMSVSGYYFWIDDRPEFFAIDLKHAKPFDETLKRSRRICVWSDGRKTVAGDSKDYANIYDVARWDGVTADDVAWAKSEVERERHKSQDPVPVAPASPPGPPPPIPTVAPTASAAAAEPAGSSAAPQPVGAPLTEAAPNSVPAGGSAGQ